MPDERQRVYVAYGVCGCCLDSIVDDREDNVKMQEVSRWIFGHMQRGHEVVRVPEDEARVVECPHGDGADTPRQKELF